MARKSLGFVPLIWDCPSCGTQNPGPIKTCTACGAPQPEDVKFLRVDEEKFNFIKDEALIRMAKAGPDIHCPWCGTRNPGTASLCSNCGGELGQGGKLRATGGKVQSVSEAKAEAEKPQPVPTSRPSTTSGFKQPLKPSSKKSIIIAVVIVAVLCLASILVISFLNKTDATTATVTDVSWERQISIEEYALKPGTGWCDELPSDAVVTATSQKYRYTSEDPVADAIEVCGDEYVVDTGTGVGEVVQDCVYEVYDYYCEYDTWGWVSVGMETSSGEDLMPYWPALNLTEDQREAEYQEDYSIIFRADGEEYTYYTDDVDLFLQAELGSTWTISVNQLGNVRSAEPNN